VPRFFNTAGPCRPEDHYMLPPERRLAGIRPLLEEKEDDIDFVKDLGLVTVGPAGLGIANPIYREVISEECL
jgi:hypothetical protein